MSVMQVAMRKEKSYSGARREEEEVVAAWRGGRGTNGAKDDGKEGRTVSGVHGQIRPPRGSAEEGGYTVDTPGDTGGRAAV